MMTLNQLMVHAAQQQVYTFTRPCYAERNTFFQVLGDHAVIMQLRKDIDVPGIAFCPTYEDLCVNDWYLTEPKFDYET
jgi:hypothetical protein